jgi:hypothetical protein
MAWYDGLIYANNFTDNQATPIIGNHTSVLHGTTYDSANDMFSFDGVDDQIELIHSADMDWSAEYHTFHMKFKINETLGGTDRKCLWGCKQFAADGDKAGVNFGFIGDFGTNGQWWLDVYSSDTRHTAMWNRATLDIDDGNWHTITIMVRRKTSSLNWYAKCYIDGYYKAADDLTKWKSAIGSNDIESYYPLVIGNGGTPRNHYIQADIKNFFIWDEDKTGDVGQIEEYAPIPNETPVITSYSPASNSRVDASSVALKCTATDADGDSLTYTFRNASDNSVIGTVSNVTQGTEASVTWSNLVAGNDYSWYVQVCDGTDTVTSPDYTFYIPEYFSFNTSQAVSTNQDISLSLQKAFNTNISPSTGINCALVLGANQRFQTNINIDIETDSVLSGNGIFETNINASTNQDCSLKRNVSFLVNPAISSDYIMNLTLGESCFFACTCIAKDNYEVALSTNVSFIPDISGQSDDYVNITLGKAEAFNTAIEPGINHNADFSTITPFKSAIISNSQYRALLVLGAVEPFHTTINSETNCNVGLKNDIRFNISCKPVSSLDVELARKINVWYISESKTTYNSDFKTFYNGTECAFFPIETEVGGPGWGIGAILRARLKDYDQYGSVIDTYDLVAMVMRIPAEGEYDIAVFGEQSDFEAFERNGEYIQFVQTGHVSDVSQQGYILKSTDDWNENAHAPHNSLYANINAIEKIDNISNLVNRSGNLFGCVTANETFKGWNTDGNGNWVSDKFGFFNIGHFFTGALDESSYLMYNPDTKKISFKGNVIDFNTQDFNLTAFNDDGNWGTRISANADAITLKASKSSVSALSNTVQDNSAEIQVVANAISSKVSQTEFDNLGNIVFQHSTQITQTANSFGFTLSEGKTILTVLAADVDGWVMHGNNINIAGNTSFVSLQDTVNGKSAVYRQDSFPSDAVVGDICYKTDEGNKPYIKIGVSAWAAANLTQIDGNHITTGIVSADRIDVTGLFAKTITATGTVTGLNLVGGLIKTGNNTTGERIEINSNGQIRFYYNNILKCHLSAISGGLRSSGNFSIVGNLQFGTIDVTTIEKIQGGIGLVGDTDFKVGRLNIGGNFLTAENGELFWKGVQIS